jgi:hypothetical protein
LVGVLAEATDRVNGLGSTIALEAVLTATLTELSDADARVIPTVTGVGPSSVSQLSVTALGVATMDAEEVTVSVTVTVTAVPVTGVNVRCNV